MRRTTMRGRDIATIRSCKCQPPCPGERAERALHDEGKKTTAGRHVTLLTGLAPALIIRDPDARINTGRIRRIPDIARECDAPVDGIRPILVQGPMDQGTVARGHFVW